MKQLTKYFALLRAINVGGSGVIKMADLKKLFESLGFTNVETYIQSGNVLFDTNEKDVSLLALKIEKKMQSIIGHPIIVFVLTPAQLKKASKQNPFHPERNEEEQCHLMFLDAKPAKECISALMNIQGSEYRFAMEDKVFYYTYSKSLAGKRRTINFEKVLGVTGTARTWKVVDKLIELSGT